MDIYFDSADSRTDAVAKSFQCHGAVVVRNLIDTSVLQNYCSAILTLITSRLNSLGRGASPFANIDDAYNYLCEIDPGLGQELLYPIRDLPNFYTLINQPSALDLAARLIGDTLFQIVHDICLFRIDPAVPDHPRLFDWHMDYPYNVLSQSALTFWIPLTDVEDDMGPLKVVLGSHKTIHAIDFVKKYAQPGKGTGHKVFSLSNIDKAALEKASVSLHNIRAGDVAILHSCLLHASGKNHSAKKKSRWVFNIRVGDILDQPVVSRGWKVVRDRDPYVFTALHSDRTTVVCD